MMLADPDDVLEKATDLRLERRFYSPQPTPELDEGIAHARAEIRRDEVGCDLEKCRYLIAHYERATGE